MVPTYSYNPYVTASFIVGTNYGSSASWLGDWAPNQHGYSGWPGQTVRLPAHIAPNATPEITIGHPVDRNPIIREFHFRRDEGAVLITITCKQDDFDVFIHTRENNNRRTFKTTQWEKVIEQLVASYNISLPETYEDVLTFLGDMVEETQKVVRTTAPSVGRPTKRLLED
jgi:hypothetical protein